MDSIKGTIASFTGGSTAPEEGSKPTGHGPEQTGLQSRGQTQESGGGTFLGQMGEKFNPAAGGGSGSGKEAAIDKDVSQAPGQIPQNDDSAIAQAKDEQISDFIRDKSVAPDQLPVILHLC